MINELSNLFIRDLNTLKSELKAYQNADKIWIIDSEIKNSAGNLALHLVGNLNHFVGHILCKTDYKRDRDAEFNSKNIIVSDLCFLINETIQIFEDKFKNVKAEKLEEDYPIQIFDDIKSTRHFLMHLLTHLSYHLGQINYHRRLLDE